MAGPGAPPPGLGSFPPLPAPAAPAPLPAPLPAMAEGGVVGGRLAPEGVDLLPGVIPAPVILAAYLDRFGGGGGQQMQRFAAGGMVSPDLLAMVQGGMGNVGGETVPALPGVVPGGDSGGLGNSDDALTPDEAAEIEQMNAGPPAPKSFTRWLESGAALASDFEFDREVAEAAQEAPDKIGALFQAVRMVLKADPSQGSPELKKAVGLPTGQPSIGQSIQADREERAS